MYEGLERVYCTPYRAVNSRRNVVIGKGPYLVVVSCHDSLLNFRFVIARRREVFVVRVSGNRVY